MPWLEVQFMTEGEAMNVPQSLDELAGEGTLTPQQLQSQIQKAIKDTTGQEKREREGK